MKTLQQIIDEMQKKHEEAVARLRKEFDVQAVLNAAVPRLPEYEPCNVHFYPLYGSVGSVTCYPAFADCLAKGKNPDKALLKELLYSFPPIDLVKVNDRGSTSFRPVLEGFDSTEFKKVDDIVGVTVKVDSSDSRAVYQWYAYVGDNIYAFRITMPLYKTTLGSLRMHASRYGGNGPVASWEICEFNSTIEPKPEQVKWGTGGPEYSSDFTLYWHSNSGMTTEKIIDSVKE